MQPDITDVSDPSRDLGLGLAICKGIVEAHGGRIWADSDGVGLGTRFTFTLLAADEQPVSERTRSTRGARTSARIELIHDILAIRDIPVIFLSAYDQDALVTKAFEAGAVDYVVKPFSPTELGASSN